MELVNGSFPLKKLNKNPHSPISVIKNLYDWKHIELNRGQEIRKDTSTSSLSLVSLSNGWYESSEDGSSDKIL